MTPFDAQEEALKVNLTESLTFKDQLLYTSFPTLARIIVYLGTKQVTLILPSMEKIIIRLQEKLANLSI